MDHDLKLKLMSVVFALIALVSMSACVVASSPASLPGNGNSDPAEPTPTAIPETEDSGEIDIEIVEDEEQASDHDSNEIAQSAANDDSDADDTHVLASDNDVETAENSPPAEANVVPERPARLQIDSIDVDAAFEYVGVTEDGNMDVPQEWENVAWYEPGTIPGDVGNAVVAGHYDSDTGPAIFYKLNELEPGDHVRVVSGDGSALVFEVTEIESVHVDDADTRKIFGKTDERNLNLITCEGIWDRSAGMYDQRLIVYTTLIDA